MPSPFRDYRLFLKECRRTFHTTGALLPSGLRLARALSTHVGGTASTSNRANDPPPRRLLEVGPGTGAVTSEILRRLGPQDRLDLVELNDRFVAHLRQRFAGDSEWQSVGGRAQVLHCGVEELPDDDPYDIIVSGLPLNNFALADVESILATFQRLLRRGGVLSFFQYIAVRPLRGAVSNRQEKERLRGISRALDGLLKHEIGRHSIWTNFPPARVHHVRFS